MHRAASLIREDGSSSVTLLTDITLSRICSRSSLKGIRKYGGVAALGAGQVDDLDSAPLETRDV